MIVIAYKNNDGMCIVCFFMIFIISLLEITILLSKGNKVVKSDEIYICNYSIKSIQKANFSLIILYITSASCIYYALMDIKVLDAIAFLDKYLWLWMILLLCMCFIKSVFLDSIIIFLQDNYYSGGDFINYNMITRIEIVKNKAINNDNLVLIHLFSDEKLIGFDKLFNDEYLFLMKKISNI